MREPTLDHHKTAGKKSPSPIAELARSQPFSFGETVSALRRRRKQRQSDIASAANLSAGYYSDLENDKRPAPPKETTTRIALALELAFDETERLLALAEAERAAASMSVNLPPSVRRLLVAILIVGPTLSARAIESIYSVLCTEADQPY